MNAPLGDIVSEARGLANKDPVEALLELQLYAHKMSLEPKSANPPTSNPLIGAKLYPECLLQNIDIFRLKALVYRDVVRNDRNKARPFVIVVRLCHLEEKFILPL